MVELFFKHCHWQKSVWLRYRLSNAIREDPLPFFSMCKDRADGTGRYLHRSGLVHL